MALTKVTGQVIKNTTDVTVGVLTVTNTLAVGGTVSIGGTLTYEDVTNIDSVGLITARNGIIVGSGITLSKDGDIFATGVSTVTTLKVGSGVTVSSDGDVFFTGIATGNGSGLTALNASNISSGTVPTARLGSGTASSSTFLRGDSTFAAVTSTTINNNADNRVITGSGTADTLEAESTLTYDGTNLDLGDSKKIRLGASQDLQLHHNGTDSNILGSFGDLYIHNTGSDADDINIRAQDDINLQVQNGEAGINIIGDGAVELYYNNVKTFHTKENGVVVEGTEGAGAILELRADQGDDNADYFRLYNDSGFLAFQNYGGGSWQNSLSLQQQNQVRLFYNGSEKLNTSNTGVSISGKIYMNNGNLQFASTGNGIDFSTGASGNASSSLLDDYEEGTWTPTYIFGGADTASYSSRSGSYTKIGNFVFAKYAVDISSRGGSGNGRFDIGGLPFTIGDKLSSTGQEVGGMVSYWNDMSAFNLINYWGQNGGTHVQLQYTNGSGRNTIGQYVTRNDCADNTGLRGYVMYQV